METVLAPAAEDKALDNPKGSGEQIAGGVTLAFIAAGTFWAANEFTKKAVADVSKDKTGADLVKVQADTLMMHGAGKVVGGVAVGVAGRYFFDGGFGAAITDGVAAGLVTSGAMDLISAAELKSPTILISVSR